MTPESAPERNEPSPSTELTGGAGFTYEDGVVGYFLAALLKVEEAAVLPGTVVRVAVQQRPAGEPLDDVVVDARDDAGERRLSLQIKRSLTISAAPSNGDFHQIIADCRATRAKPDFRVGRDNYGFVVETVAAGPMRNLRRILEHARSTTNAGEFALRFSDAGATSEPLREMRQSLRELVAATDEAEWDFYRHFAAPDMSGLNPSGALFATVAAGLADVLVQPPPQSGTALFRVLCRLAREGAGAGKIWTRPVLIEDLSPLFRFRGVPAFTDDLDIVRRMTATAISEIPDEIGAYHVDRTSTVERALALASEHRLVNITGLPGCGKSAILRNIAERLAADNTVLLLKSDLLVGSDWQGLAVAKGLSHRNPVDLLTELGSTGNRILLIDGIDRIPPPQRNVVKDLMRAIIEEPGLAAWRVIVTSRNQGMEPFRVWVPVGLYGGQGIGDLQVSAFSPEESEQLAANVPALREVLFGAAGVQDIARRPFFAAVLAGRHGAGTDAANAKSETDLISYWWGGGGHDASGEALLLRQRALLDLSRVGARSLGKSVRALSLQPETIARVAGLVNDGILRTSDEHATYSFTHDIFFEWAFFRLLVGLGADWTVALVQAGQPPLLGRVVALLAQRAIQLGTPWNEGLERLVGASLRPQWRRAWLTGPPASAEFRSSKERFTEALFANDYALLRSFLVWFQAEHTIPNPIVLGNTGLALEGPQRVRLADYAGWPSDIGMWSRVIAWLIGVIEQIPVRLRPQVLEVFGVWQNQFVATANAVSAAIIAQCAAWLQDIESVSYGEELSFARGRWEELRGESLRAFEGTLRQTILAAMRVYPEPGNVELDSATSNERLRRQAFEGIVAYSATIAAVSPEKLADLARAELVEPLPRDEMARAEEERRQRREWFARIRAKPEAERTENERKALAHVDFAAFGSERDYDLDDLAIDKYHHAYFPTSPLHEPFASLFRSSPDVARALVRDLGNHATTAWRQIHEIGSNRYGTPLPVDLDFPWGRQRFWGDWNGYIWVDDAGVPQPLACAFLALAYWAHKELDGGVSVDDVIRQVVEGHESLTVLNLATSLALERVSVSATVLPIAAAQRLWEMDIARAVQDPMRGIDLLGFGILNRLTGDKEAAMAYLKGRTSRRRDVRELAMRFAYAEDTALREAFREKLAQFPEDLPFAFAEERDDEQRIAALREQAEQWAGLGDAANYRARPADDPDHVIIEYQSPLALAEGTQERLREVSISLNEYAVAGWVNKSLQAGQPDPSATLASLLTFVRGRDATTSFDHLTPSGHGMTQSAISGVAAVALLYGAPTPEDEAWAWDVIRRVEAMQEQRDYFGGGNIPWHPAYHLIAVLAADLKRPQPRAETPARLLGLCIHPNMRVAEVALATLLNAPDITLAWNAIVLANDLWVHRAPVMRRDGTRNDAPERSAEKAAMERAMARLRSADVVAPAALPAPWPSRRRERSPFEDYVEEAEPQVSFNHTAAERLIRSVPVERFCSSEAHRPVFIRYVEQLVQWTAARFNPDDSATAARGSRRPERAHLNEWPARLGGLLSRIAPFVEVDQMRDVYLAPFLASGDENGLDVMADFTQSLVCRHVLDAPVVPPNVSALLDLCLDQLIGDPDFRRGSYRAGEVHGYDLPQVIKALLFVPIDQEAPNAARFANGDWRDLGSVLPLVERLVGEIGWAPYVMDTFLTMAERAGLAFPVDAFSSLMTKVLSELGENANGWVGTLIPARIAGVLQVIADGNYPLSATQATTLLRVLDMLIDLGDRRSAALEESETFRSAQTG